MGAPAASELLMSKLHSVPVTSRMFSSDQGISNQLVRCLDIFYAIVDIGKSVRNFFFNKIPKWVEYVVTTGGRGDLEW